MCLLEQSTRYSPSHCDWPILEYSEEDSGRSCNRTQCAALRRLRDLKEKSMFHKQLHDNTSLIGEVHLGLSSVLSNQALPRAACVESIGFKSTQKEER